MKNCVQMNWCRDYRRCRLLTCRLAHWEWHGPHMPLGADGIQSKELFVRVAEKIGGVVLPMLFMGPDRVFHDGGKSFYGMDINTEGALNTYCVQQMKGSAYWMEKELFQNYLRSIFAQLSRVGVRIVVGHGHGPSIKAFQELKEEAEEKFGLSILTAWTFAEDERLRYQNDHAGANETSIVMAVRPEKELKNWSSTFLFFPPLT